jgi:hypothetical protein
MTRYWIPVEVSVIGGLFVEADTLEDACKSMGEYSDAESIIQDMRTDGDPILGEKVKVDFDMIIDTGGEELTDEDIEYAEQILKNRKEG